MGRNNDGVYLLTIPGRLPNLNDYIDAERRNRQAAAKLKREAQEYIGWYIRRDLRGVRFKGPVVMQYTWIEKDRRRDRDNITFGRKFIQDALVQAGVLRDDGWDEIAGFSDDFQVDKNKARVEVRIWEYSGEPKKKKENINAQTV